MSEYDYSNYLAESGLDESLWARFDEAKKALKTVKCCNKLQWSGPDANEVNFFSFASAVSSPVTSLLARWPSPCLLATTRQRRVFPT